MNRNLLTVFIGMFSVLHSMGQNGTCSISGSVLNELKEPIPGVSIIIISSEKGTTADLNGKFSLSNLLPGKYEIKISGVGYESQMHVISLKAHQHYELNTLLEENTTTLNELIIRGKSESQEIREKGFSVQVIDNKKLKNATADINQVLAGSLGINIRESGGFGSGFNLSLNGLAGNQIRYFIDGIPMENFGSALTLNNFQVNLIEKIEVYKGVVPIELGADALGGAINIVTGYQDKSFLDLSYSYGSFNTSRASINGQYIFPNKKSFIKASGFYNFSDNSYWMEDVPVYDLELGNFLGNIKTRRFHDQYTSTMANVETGLINTVLADKLSIAIIVAQNKKNYQHPDNNIQRVFGSFKTQNVTRLVNINYQKQLSKFHLNGYLLGGRVKETIADTSHLKYNWAGDFVLRDEDDPKGELVERRSLLILTDQVLKSQIGVQYEPVQNHLISINFTQNYLKREGKDEFDAFNQSFISPNSIYKNILGAGYSFTSSNQRINLSAFVKQYWFGGKLVYQDVNNATITSTPSLSNQGFGTAISYSIKPGIRFKTSFEKAYRIPESYEILGDGIYVNPNPTLQPEESYNANLGGVFTKTLSKSKYDSEFNLFYRKSGNFIRFNPLGPFGEYENLDNVNSIGIEGGGSYHLNDLLDFSLNFTYQHITDQTKYDEGLPNTNYQSRVPNIPYFFTNTRLGYHPTKKWTKSDIRIYWNLRYIHDFYLTWENLGNQNSKYIIPSQLINDLQVDYMLDDGKYNLSLSVNNLFNTLAYDNFSIQKPRRAIYLKVRVFLQSKQ